MDDLNRRVCEKLHPCKIVMRGCVREPECGSVFEVESLNDPFPGNWFQWPCVDRGKGVYDECPNYTTDLNACFRDVVPRMKNGVELIGYEDGSWLCSEGYLYSDGTANEHKADTPAEAICRAFLAMEGE